MSCPASNDDSRLVGALWKARAIRRQFIWLAWFIWFVTFPTKRTKKTK